MTLASLYTASAIRRSWALRVGEPNTGSLLALWLWLLGAAVVHPQSVNTAADQRNMVVTSSETAYSSSPG